MDIVQKCQLHISEVKAKITDLLELPTEKRGEDYDGDLEKGHEAGSTRRDPVASRAPGAA